MRQKFREAKTLESLPAVKGDAPIFVGGTGRSGTSILGDFIGGHPRILRLPYEIRIFTDRGGLLDLKNSLTGAFSQQSARAAIQDFKSFTDALCCPYTAPYLGYNVNKRMQTDLSKARSNFFGDILLGEFSGWDKELHDRFALVQVPARIVRRGLGVALSRCPGVGRFVGNNSWKTFVSHETLPIPRYFQSSEPLIAAIRDFISELFGPMMEASKSETWCDATPSNLAYIEQLSEIYPDAKFIHVVRHPLGVAQSMTERRWMPARSELVASFLAQSYERIANQMDRADGKGNTITVKIEDLSDPHTQLKLSDFLDLDFAGHNQHLIQSSISEGWRERISIEDSGLFEEVLRPYLQRYDYTD